MDPGHLSDVVRSAARSLAVDQVTAEVVAALHARDVHPILLKGPTFANWLYADGEHRAYVDTDLLVAPEHQLAAAEVLAALGFVDHMAAAAAHEVDDHSRTFQRDEREVDLHFTLAGARAGATVVWEQLSKCTEQALVAGQYVAALSPPALALHAALHAAQGDHGRDQPLHDLERACRVAEPKVWRGAADLAAVIDAGAAFGAGLDRLPAGRKLLHTLDVATGDATLERLRAGSPPAMALGIARLAGRHDRQGLLRELVREVVPTPTFMRLWSPLARRGPAGLAVAYLWRPVSLAIRLGPAIRAYRRARSPADRVRKG